MKSVILSTIILLGGVVVSQTNITNCVVSKTNPYSSLPMVCKAVLKVPKKPELKTNLPIQGSSPDLQGSSPKLQGN